MEVAVDGPVTVEVVETAGTVAYDMRGGSARWDVDLVLSGGARVAWHGEPFVVSSGADVDRRTTASVAAGSRPGAAGDPGVRPVRADGRHLAHPHPDQLRRRAGARRGPRPVAATLAILDDPARAPVPRHGHHRRRPPARRPRRAPGRAQASLARCLCDEVHRSDDAGVAGPAALAPPLTRCLGSGHDRLGTAVPRPRRRRRRDGRRPHRRRARHHRAGHPGLDGARRDRPPGRLPGRHDQRPDGRRPVTRLERAARRRARRAPGGRPGRGDPRQHRRPGRDLRRASTAPQPCGTSPSTTPTCTRRSAAASWPPRSGCRCSRAPRR